MTYPLNLNKLAQDIKQWGRDLGFQQVAICATDLSIEEPRLQAWLDNQYHGDMAWMARYGMLRARPHELMPEALRVISVRMNYLPPDAAFARTLNNPLQGYISRYALGRDYHKVLRQRLRQLAQKMSQQCAEHHFRPFVDSAPLLERPLAAKAGLGWVGKNSLLLNRQAGSWFFLGELLIDLPLPVDTPEADEGCGRCVACMTLCPTGAIVEPYIVDARRCISYLTIELEGAIPVELRPLMGNRIYGCDDCQLICPWNRAAPLTEEADFKPRPALHRADLVTLFSWSEQTFLRMTEGSPIRRIGYQRWLRNIAVALGNAPWQQEIITVLRSRSGLFPLVDEHIEWALEQQYQRRRSDVVEVISLQQQRLIRAVNKGLPRDA
ncbi:MAG: tRNA epoxyqueuosine(34) reductase QueG [Enterobacteriaceae bacterium]